MMMKFFKRLFFGFMTAIFLTGCHVQKASVSSQENLQTVDDASVQEAVFLVREVIVRRWMFEPAEIRVPVNTNLRLSLQSLDVDAEIFFPAFDVTKTIESGKSVEVDIPLRQRGAYAFYITSYPVTKGVVFVQ